MNSATAEVATLTNMEARCTKNCCSAKPQALEDNKAYLHKPRNPPIGQQEAGNTSLDTVALTQITMLPQCDGSTGTGLHNAFSNRGGRDINKHGGQILKALLFRKSQRHSRTTRHIYTSHTTHK